MPPEAGASQISDRALKNKRWLEILKQVGDRHKDCRLTNYLLNSDPDYAQRQTEALGRLSAYCGDIPSLLKTGNGLIIYGPCGTGKDHLVVGAIYRAIDAGVDAMFVNGVRLARKISETIGADAKTDLVDVVKKYAAPDILAISDILLPSGNLSGYHKDALYQIINERYKNLKPTWLTANAHNKEQMDAALSPQVVSRLAHGALTINCEWPDWRLQK